MKRMFICTERIFPRGDAGANYIQYFAQALLEKNWEVTVISCGKKQYDASGKIITNHKGIQCEYLDLPENKIQHYLSFTYCLGKIFVKKLKNLGFSDDDYVGFYTYNKCLVEGVLNSALHIKKERSVIFCVEWYQKENYINDKFGSRYRRYNDFFRCIYPECGKIFSISKLINEHFKSIGCETMILPIMADVTEYVTNEDVHAIKSIKKDTVDFIYSGNANNKDSFSVMFRSVALAREKYGNRIVFHLTGIKREKLEKVLGFDAEIIEKLGDSLIIHPWLRYEELVNLLRTMDFLLLPREDIHSNRANFPSKLPEMMSYGIIPICSNVGDYAEGYIKNHENGFLMNGCDEKVCFDAIDIAMSLSKDKREEMAMDARKTVEAKFDYHNWTEIIDDFLINPRA